MEWKPRVIVIGPGGFKILKVLGFLSPIEGCGLLNYVDTYCGVSAGAITSLLLVAGYQIRDIIGEVTTLNIFQDLENFTIRSMVNNKGVISSEPIKQRLTDLLLEKFGTVPTLHGLYTLTGKAYIAVTLNATDDKCEMMGPFTHPDVSCIDATMFSINIPFIFYQLTYHGKTYVDGALANPYPVEYFDDGNTNILGIYMKAANNCEDSEVLPLPIYSYKIVHSLMNQKRHHVTQNSSNRCKHVCLETNKIDLVGCGINKGDRADMLVEGFNEGKSFIEQLSDDSHIDDVHIKEVYSYPPYYMINDLEPT